MRTLACAGVFVAAGLSAQGASEDVPYVTTPDNVTLTMLELAKVGRRDRVIDLGSGDGRIVIVAAKRFGARGLGVEIDPKLVAQSRENAKRAGVASRVEIREQDLFNTDLSGATVITMYLLPEVNIELRPKLLALSPGTRIVSHDWDMGDWKPDRSVTVAARDKKIGLEKSSRVHLWIVPAQVEGVWCGGGERLEIAQQFQRVRVNGAAGVVEGGTARVAPDLALRLEQGKLRATRASGRFSKLKSQTFERLAGRPAACPTY